MSADGRTVRVAESHTGGMLSAALTSLAGASAAFHGGLAVYATDLKHQLARVPVDVLDRFGAVHADVALELARGARDVLGASIGVGVTGVAGPDEQDGCAVGTMFLAVVGVEETVVERHFAGGRAEIRTQTVDAAL